jgi:pimeloyl-ACP methyl ester carboxylesterase
MLTRFGLFHSSAYADAEEKKETRKKGIAFIRENGAYAFLKTATPNLFSPHTRENNPGLVERQVALGQQFGDDVLISYYEAMMRRPDRTAVLKEATVPVLFVMGKYDQAVPVDDSLKQSHLPAVSHIHILENSGHMGMLEEAEKANGILAKFMAAGTPHAHLSS